eukprot:12881860-Ditylum_brightwellii.AAC.1
MACFVYHTKSCPHGRLTLVLAHGKRSSSSTIVQLAIVASLSLLRFSAGLFLPQSAVAIVRHLASLLFALLFQKGSNRLALLLK